MDQVRKRLNFLLIVAILGLIDSAWLSYLHLSGGNSSLCHISTSIHCGVLGITQYSEILGIPLAVFATLFYLFVLAIAWVGIQSDSNQIARPTAYLFILSWFAISATVSMAYISLFRLKAFCPFCGVLYLISLFFLFFSWQALQLLGQPWGYLVRYDLKHAHTSFWFWVPILVGGLLVLGGRTIFEKKSQVSDFAVQVSSAENRTLGVPNAPITVAVFSDFQCPYCKVAGQLMHELESEMHGKIKIVYKFFPLDASCNPLGGAHQHSCLAARASYCASKENKFWAFHDLLFSEQETIDEERINHISQTLSLSPQFSVCLQSSEAFKAIEDDLNEGARLHLEGTPSLFMNGKKYSGAITLGGFKSALNDF